MGKRPHILAGGIAVALFLSALVGFDRYARAMESRYIHELAPLHIDQNLEGVALPTEALKHDDLLSVYGSSELRLLDGYAHEYNARELLASQPTGFDVFLLDRGGTSLLNHAQKLAAVFDGLHDRRIAISLSPIWFVDSGSTDDPAYYGGTFSKLAANYAAFEAPISQGLRHDLATRMLQYPDTLEDDPLLHFALKHAAQSGVIDQLLYRLALPLGRLNLEIMQLQDHRDCLGFIRRLARQPSAEPESTSGKDLNFPVWVERGQRHYKPRSTNNPFGIDTTVWLQRHDDEMRQKSDLSSDQKFLDHLNAATGWWTDLDLVLRSLHEAGAKSLLISPPLNGSFYDYCGVSLTARNEFYHRIRQAAAAYGVAEVDFSDHDEDRYFSIDAEAHMAPEGWVYYTAAFDAFMHDRLGENHTIAINPATQWDPATDPHDYEGEVDHAGADSISGWVWDLSHPDAPVPVDIIEGDRVIAHAMADQFRADLLQNGKGNGKHAFSVPVPAALADGKSYSVLARVRGEPFMLSDETLPFAVTPHAGTLP